MLYFSLLERTPLKSSIILGVSFTTHSTKAYLVIETMILRMLQDSNWKILLTNMQKDNIRASFWKYYCSRQLSLEYLGRKFGKEVVGLSALDKALARSLRIVMEDHLNWVLLIDRYIDREEGRTQQRQLRNPSVFDTIAGELTRRKAVHSTKEQVLIRVKQEEKVFKITILYNRWNVKWITERQVAHPTALLFINRNGWNFVCRHIFSRCLDMENFRSPSPVLTELGSF